jgi:hypothetical protein
MKHERSSNVVGMQAFRGTFAALTGAIALAFVAGPAACSSSSGDASTSASSTTTSTTHAGGAGGGTGAGGHHICPGVVVNGKCVEACTPDKCVAGNVCVGNECKLPCSTLADCALDGTQVCAAAKEDGSNKDVTVCLPSGKIGGKSCPLGTECGGASACPDGSACDTKQCNGNPADCKVDADKCGADANCNLGKCSDGSACTVFKCDAAECKPLVCHSAGPGDADAYCTHLDCKADTDCAAGYFCGIQHDPHDVCGPKCVNKVCDSGLNKGGACAKDGECQKGNNDSCGKTSEACIDPADFAKDGATYAEGPICLSRNVCRKRLDCAPCETDLDCSEVPAQKCVDVAGTKGCARTCNVSKDCPDDFKCDVGACVPRSGACRGKNFCEHCVDDRDCADGATCYVGFDGQRACIKLPIDKTCTKDSDCPKSPSGRYGACLSETQNVTADSPAYHHCYLPYNAAKSKFECWY